MTKATSTTKPNNPKTTQSSPPRTKAPKLEKPDFPAAASSAPTKAKTSTPRKKTPPAAEATSSKQERLIAMMKQAKGSTMAELMTATGWQAHSIRGVISGVLKKRLSLNVILEASSDGVRRYRILKSAQA
jgi:hypothetical protein